MFPRVLALVGDMDGCALWRVLQPFTELQRQGYPAEWGARGDDRLANIVHEFDAVIIPRLHWPPEERENGDRWFEALHNAGIAVIYEVDDDMVSDDFIRRLVQIHSRVPRKAEETRDAILHTMQSADGVTVSSQRLASTIRRYTDRPIMVVPNYMDLDWFRAVQAKAERTVKGLSIGWAGGIRPDYDVEQMAIAWGRITQRYPDVQFVIQGWQPDIITQAVPAERLHRLPWMSIQEYPTGLVNVDIGCCPLTDTTFNRAKTFIKSMEYAVSGAAVVASPTVYGQIIDHGHNGYICSNADEWEDALSRLVESANIRKRMAQQLLWKVEKYHSLHDNAWRWVDAWAQIVERYRLRNQGRRIITPTPAQVREFSARIMI